MSSKLHGHFSPSILWGLTYLIIYNSPMSQIKKLSIHRHCLHFLSRRPDTRESDYHNITNISIHPHNMPSNHRCTTCQFIRTITAPQPHWSATPFWSRQQLGILTTVFSVSKDRKTHKLKSRQAYRQRMLRESADVALSGEFKQIISKRGWFKKRRY